MEQKIYTSKLNQMPHEKDFIATLLAMPWEVKKATEDLLVDRDYFHSEAYQEIFLGLQEYIRAFEDDVYAIDVSTLRDYIKTINPHTLVSEVDIQTLILRGNETKSIAGDPIKFYAERLKAYNQKRLMADLAEKIGDITLNPQMKGSELYGHIRHEVDSHLSALETIEDVFYDKIETEVKDLLRKVSDGDDVRHQPMGFRLIDKRIGGGFAPGSMVVVAARPGCGKTTLMMNMAENLIEDQSTENRPVVFFSLEMTKERLFEKLLTAYSEVSLSEIRAKAPTTRNATEKLDSHMRKAFYRNGKAVSSLLICDKGAISLSQIHQQLKKIYNERGGITAVFIDYLQLMKAPGKFDSRNYELGEISRALREMAKEFETTFVVAAQLNRQIEANNKSMNGTETPKNSYLRDSGAIEQDADLIMFLTPDTVLSESVKTVKLHITKNRFGSVTGDNPIELQFNGAISLFSEPVKHALSGYYNRKGPSEYQGN